MRKNEGVINAGKPGLWKRKQSPYGLLRALRGTRLPLTDSKPRTPTVPRGIAPLEPSEAHGLRRSRRPGRPVVLFLLLLLRRERPAQDTCSEVTGTPPTPPRQRQPSPEPVPNVRLRAAARTSQALSPPLPEGRNRRGSSDATTWSQLPRRRHLGVT